MVNRQETKATKASRATTVKPFAAASQERGASSSRLLVPAKGVAHPPLTPSFRLPGLIPLLAYLEGSKAQEVGPAPFCGHFDGW